MPRCVERYRSSAFSEERLEDGTAVGSEDAGGDFYLVVDAQVGEDFEARANGATFGIVGAIDDARDTRLNDGAGAHAAGLDSDVERGVRESVIAEKAGSLAEDYNFGVGGRVAIADSAVAGTSEDLAVVDEDSADRDFAGFGSGAGFR